VSNKWMVGYRIRFRDGGAPEAGVLAYDLPSEKEAKKVADLLPAISYSGDRPVLDADILWCRQGSVPRRERPSERNSPSIISKT
jgi:hypothetical protein